MKVLRSGNLGPRPTREQECRHCNAVLEYDSGDVMETGYGMRAIRCPECGLDSQVHPFPEDGRRPMRRPVEMSHLRFVPKDAFVRETFL